MQANASTPDPKLHHILAWQYRDILLETHILGAELTSSLPNMHTMSTRFPIPSLTHLTTLTAGTGIIFLPAWCAFCIPVKFIPAPTCAFAYSQAYFIRSMFRLRKWSR